jgi:hypothetical protein
MSNKSDASAIFRSASTTGSMNAFNALTFETTVLAVPDYPRSRAGTLLFELLTFC